MFHSNIISVLFGYFVSSVHPLHNCLFSFHFLSKIFAYPLRKDSTYFYSKTRASVAQSARRERERESRVLWRRSSVVEKFRRRSLAFGAYRAACRKTGEQQWLLRCVPTRILRVSRLRGNRVSNAGNRETHVNPFFA